MVCLISCRNSYTSTWNAAGITATMKTNILIPTHNMKVMSRGWAQSQQLWGHPVLPLGQDSRLAGTCTWSHWTNTEVQLQTPKEALGSSANRTHRCSNHLIAFAQLHHAVWESVKSAGSRNGTFTPHTDKSIRRQRRFRQYISVRSFQEAEWLRFISVLLITSTD